MSVKAMTTTQIRDNLKTIALTWPDGIPWQQADQVNALKGELKRRGETFEKPADPAINVTTIKATSASTDDELQEELRDLSERIGRDSKDEAAQQRFADVRYELRQRALKGEPVPPARSPLPPRELELPDEDEIPMKPRPQNATSPAPKKSPVKRSSDDDDMPDFPVEMFASDAPSTIPADPPKNLVVRVCEQLLVHALREIEAGQYNEAAQLVHTFVALRGSIRDKPY